MAYIICTGYTYGDTTTAEEELPMRHSLSLRQIEAFKAVMEHGTISRAAEVLHVSQPAMSKMIANLEADAGLLLFDRLKGRLAPTARGMRLYDEIDRIFAGVRQVENAMDAIRREDQGRMAIGVMPALSGSFVQRVTTAFLKRHPQVFCVVETRSSQRIAEWLVTRKLDVGFIMSGLDNPYLVSETLLEMPRVCVMPIGHPLAAKDIIRPPDLDGLPFVSFDPETSAGTPLYAMFAEYRIHPHVVLVATVSQTLCQFVAAGHGVSLIHPLMAKEYGQHLILRPFEPAKLQNFQICYSREGRNTRLVADFVAATREVAASFRAAW
jgi:DNA-binding transcriptional LysR family regulator